MKGVHPGVGYLCILDDDIERPDPASCFQLNEVHDPSQITDHQDFYCNDEEWKGTSPEKNDNPLTTQLSNFIHGNAYLSM